MGIPSVDTDAVYREITGPCDSLSECMLELVERFGDALHYDESRPSFVMKYDPEIINAMMREGRECGFFVTHNHPVWSSEEYTDYVRYDGMHAMEICNFGSCCGGHDEHNAKIKKIKDFIGISHFAIAIPVKMG